MKKNIKSVQDVQNVPEDEYIWTVDYGKETCPFCGEQLRYKTIKWQHGTTRLYEKCNCEVAQAAEVHNRRVKELQYNAWLECRKKEEKEREKK